MTLPWRHPQHGVWYARLWVPVDLKPIIKKDEVRRSLRTKDSTEAKRLFKQVVAEIEAEWEELREAAQFAAPSIPERTISEKEAHALAGEIYRRVVAAHEDNPGTPERWETELAGLQRMLPLRERALGAAPIILGPWSQGTRSATRAFGAEVRAFLETRDDNLDVESFARLCAPWRSEMPTPICFGTLLGTSTRTPRRAVFPLCPQRQ